MSPECPFVHWKAVESSHRVAFFCNCHPRGISGVARPYINHPDSAYWILLRPVRCGWKVIKIHGAFMYAKFARIAINWIAEKPEGDNVISQELQKLLGLDLLAFDRPHRVMIAAASDSDCWNITAV